MALELARFYEPVSPDEPSGPALHDGESYISQAYLEVAKASEYTPLPPTPENAGRTAEEPDWNALAREAGKLLAKSRDLNLVLFIASASLRKGSLVDFCECLLLADHLLSSQWDTVSPPLADGPPDEAVLNRQNALARMGDLREFIRPLMERLAVEGRPKDDGGVLVHSLAVPDASGELAESLSAAIDALARMQARLDEADPRGPRFSQGLTDLLEAALSEVESVLGISSAGDEGDMRMGDVSGTDPTSAPAPAAAPGQISSRSDIDKALQRSVQWLEVHEPSSPVLPLLERARSWLGKDFLALLEELAPDALGNVSKTLGREGTE